MVEESKKSAKPDIPSLPIGGGSEAAKASRPDDGLRQKKPDSSRASGRPGESGRVSGRPGGSKTSGRNKPG